MNRNDTIEARVLAVDPTSRGFAFAVLEGPERLIDWGVKHAAGDKFAHCLTGVQRLMDRYRPDVLALEDPLGRDSRRCRRARELIGALAGLASERNMLCRGFSRAWIRAAFSPTGTITKQGIAVVLATRFPELAPRLPRARSKPWLNEQERMNVFDAAALAVTFFQFEQMHAAA